MDVIVGLRAHLAAEATLTALVPASRIYSPILEARATYPAIQLQIVSSTREAHLRGPNGEARDRIQIDVWAKTRDTAIAVGRLVRQLVNGYSGTWIGSGSPAPTITVQGMFLDLGSEIFESEIAGGLVRQSADYRITYVDSEEQVLL